MDFYYVSEDYIKYLKEFDDKVAFNKSETRPYIGVVFEIGKHKYFAPLSSPKGKHLTMKNGIDFRKIDSGKLGVINFNNMIPVPNTELIPIVFNMIADLKYKNLLLNQYRSIALDTKGIVSTATNLYKIVTSEGNKNPYYENVIKRCCDFKLLEEKMDDYPMED